MKKIIFIGLGVLLLFYIVLQCTSKDPREKYSGNFKVTLPTLGDGESTGTLKRVYMVVDDSKSMLGYLDMQKTESSDSTKESNFIFNISKFLNNFKYKYNGNAEVCCGETNNYNDVEKFLKGLRENSKTLLKNNSTFVDELIKTACGEVNDTTVSVVVSDMVLSWGPNRLENEGYDFNRRDLENGLKGQVNNAALEVKTKGYDIMIVKYDCDFNGHYYYNNRENRNDKGNKEHLFDNKLMRNRPYYLMFIGKKEFLVNLYNDCLEESDFVYTSFGLKEGKESEYRIAEKNTKRWTKCEAKDTMTGTFYCDKDYKNEVTEFEVEYDKFILPRYINIDSIRVHVSDSCFKIKEYSYNYSKNKFRYTLVLPKHNEINKPEIEVKIILKHNINPSSITIMEDVATKENVNDMLERLKGKTWGFSAIIDAIDDAYYGKDKREESIVISRAKIKFIND